MSQFELLKKPLVTEKSSHRMEGNVYTFLVNTNATKVGIKQAFEKLFGEKVGTVRIINVRKKVRLIGKGKEMEKRQAGKKAVIRLKKGAKKVDVFQSQNNSDKK